MTQLLRTGHLFDEKHPDQNRGWVIGDYINDPAFRTDKFQLKYQEAKAGTFREAKEIQDSNTNSMAIMIHGSCRAKFVETDQEVFLKIPGDYIRWGPDAPHEFEYLTDCLIITVRW
tara:strand:- start:129 stop:476 length:348 start_codon:yes stop_codon:yes gene_type:complete